MKFYDFDTSAPDRRGTGSYKWDSDPHADVIPLWVADMDFRTAPPIVEALRRRVDHGVFGYVRVPDEYYAALSSWFGRRYGWPVDRDKVIYTSGVVPAVSACIKAMTKPGQGVIVQTPVYNCFFSSIRNNGCRVVENPLVRVDTWHGFTYRMDFEGLERLCADPSNTLLLLCNPHNPAGRCWTPDELSTLCEICNRHGVCVVSDEIHCDLVMPRMSEPRPVFTPYALVAGQTDWVVCNSPSKAFNTAGLQIANIVCNHASTREAVDRAININEVCDVNPFGVVGLIAAYTQCDDWLAQLLDYIHANYCMLRDMLSRELPSCPVADLEATYLAWIDITSTGLTGTQIEEALRRDHGVWVNAGDMYGCDNYVRINLACPGGRLREGLRRFVAGVKEMMV